MLIFVLPAMDSLKWFWMPHTAGFHRQEKRMFVVGALGASDGFLDEELKCNLAQKPMSIHDYLGDSLGIDYYFRVPTNYNRRGVF